MAQQGFDLSRLSTGGKILLGAGALFFIDLFLPWQRACVDLGEFGDLIELPGTCATASGWGGSGSFFGALAGLLVLALIAWEVVGLSGSAPSVGIPAAKLSAYLGWGVLAFAVLKFLLALGESATIFAWVGLALAIAIGYGAWMRFQEPAASLPPRPASGEDGGMFR